MPSAWPYIGDTELSIHEPRVAQDRDLLGELTHAGVCTGCPWRGEQRNTWHAADSDARAHVAASETHGPTPAMDDPTPGETPQAYAQRVARARGAL